MTAEIPSDEQLAEYRRLAEMTIAVQHAYQRGYEEGRAAERQPAAAPGGRTREAREEIARVLRTDYESEHETDEPVSAWYPVADVVLAVPAVADALAAVERVCELHRQEYGLCMECSGSHGVPWPCATIRVLRGDP